MHRNWIAENTLDAVSDVSLFPATKKVSFDFDVVENSLKVLNVAEHVKNFVTSFHACVVVKAFCFSFFFSSICRGLMA